MSFKDKLAKVGVLQALRCVWHRHYSPFRVVVLLGVIFPVVFITLRFLSAMWWRLVGDTPFYKWGFVFQAVCIAVVGLCALIFLRASWNASKRYTPIPRLGVFSASFSLLAFWFFAPNFVSPLRGLINDTTGRVYYLQGVTPEGFVALKEQLEKAIFPPKKITIVSGGGDAFAGLAIAKLIRDYQLDVYVHDFCVSSCANYLFPAGRNKWLAPHAIVVYHGNSQQKKIQKLREEIVEVDGDPSKLPLDYDYGVANKEAVINVHPHLVSVSADALYLREYLGLPMQMNLDQVLVYWEQLEKQFYEELGVDPKIGIYGQIGEYQATYESYGYIGFYYSTEDLIRLGLKHVRVQNGVWQPELNPLFTEVYKVTLNRIAEYSDSAKN